MDIRKNEKNKLQAEMDELNIYIKNIENELAKLKNQPSSEYINHQIKKEEANLQLKFELLNQTKLRYEQIDTGLMDSELRFQQNLVTEEINKKKSVMTEKNKIAKARKEADKQISKEYYMKQKKDDKQHKNKEKEYQKAYNHFTKADKSMPEYMIKNLKNMPNNKGYIWKSIWYFGHKKPEKGSKSYTLFERQKGNIFAIIEFNSEYYRIYHKKQNSNKKILVYEEARKQKY